LLSKNRPVQFSRTMTEPAAPLTPPAPPAAGNPPPALATPPAADAPKAPEGLPPIYWDDKTNTVRTDDLAKDFVGLHKFKSDADARMAAVPEKIEGYKLELPTEFAVPQGMKVAFDEKDPRVAAARTFAKENGLDQAAFSKMLAFDAQQQVADFNAALANIEAEQAKLGEKFPEREKAMTSFVSTALTGTAEQKAAKHQALQRILTSAAAFEGFEDVINKLGGARIPAAGGDPPPAASTKSQAERIWPGGFTPTPQAKVG
jgi:hypothetical protein